MTFSAHGAPRSRQTLRAAWSAYFNLFFTLGNFLCLNLPGRALRMRNALACSLFIFYFLFLFVAAQLGMPNICSALNHNLVSAKSGSQHLVIVNGVGVVATVAAVAVAVAAGVGVGARFDLQSMNALAKLCNTFFFFCTCFWLWIFIPVNSRAVGYFMFFRLEHEYILIGSTLTSLLMHLYY